MPHLERWSDALAALDIEQQDLVQQLTAEPGRALGDLARRAGRSSPDADRIVGEALLYLGRLFRDQSRAATDGRGR